MKSLNSTWSTSTFNFLYPQDLISQFLISHFSLYLSIQLYQSYVIIKCSFDKIRSYENFGNCPQLLVWFLFLPVMISNDEFNMPRVNSKIKFHIIICFFNVKITNDITYPLTQCAAVMTNCSVIMDPPQYNLSPNWMPTVHGYVPGLVTLPLTILACRAAVPHTTSKYITLVFNFQEKSE